MPSVDDLRIGDFSKPLAAPVTPAVAGTTEAALKEAEAKLEQAAAKDEATLKPLQSYAERLRDVGLTREQAAEIVDSVLLKGHYAKDYAITKSIGARFRTRNARDTRRAQDRIESLRLSYEHHYNEVLSRFLLAASLERFGNDALLHPGRNASADEVEKLFEARLTYVENLSDPALRILLVKLRDFDVMVSTVLAEGSIENF